MPGSPGSAYTQTIFPGGIPWGYFSKENIEFVQNKINEVLKGRVFCHNTFVPEDSVVRVMQRVLEEAREDIPNMNRRVVMNIVNEIRRHQTDVNNHLRWEEYYVASQSLNDMYGKRTNLDRGLLKISNAVGSTTRFYFT